MTVRDTLRTIADAYRSDERNLTRAPWTVHGNLTRAPWTFRVPAIARGGFTRDDVRAIRQASRRIATIAASATDAQTVAGLTWYTDALASVSGVAREHGVTQTVAARVLACVSPGLPWERNVDGVRAVLASASGVAIRDAVAAARLPVPYGWRPWTDAVAVARGAALTGPKRQAFTIGVLTGGITEHVTVDGHAYLAAWTDTDGDARPAIGRAVNVTDRRFDLTAAAYALASVAIGDALGQSVSPAQAQAIAWTVWRDRKVTR